MPDHKEPCSELQILQTKFDNECVRMDSKVGSIEQWHELFLNDIFPRMERQTKEMVNYIHEMTMDTKHLKELAERSTINAHEAKLSADRSDKAMRKMWIPLAVILLSSIASVFAVARYMNDANLKLLDAYQEVKLSDIETQNTNQGRLEKELDELKCLLRERK